MVEVDLGLLLVGSVVFVLVFSFFFLGLWLLFGRKKNNDVVAVERKVVHNVKKQEEHDYEGAVGFNSLVKNKSKMSLRYWKDWWYERKHPATTSLINMELLNGFHKLFLVKEKDEGFKYRGKKYLFDNEAKYFIIDSKLWAYDYHETFSLPIKRVIPVTNIRKTIEQSGVSEVEYATNPATLERFAVSKIAEGIMRGAELDAVFKFLKLMSVIILVVVVLHLVLFAQKSGVLSQVAIPGVNL